MTLVREIGSEILAQFAVPTRGTWKNVALHNIPPDAVFDSLNVFIREGKLRNRPGYTLYDDTIFQEPVLGGFMVVTPYEKIVLAITQHYVYELSDVTQTWTQRQITASAGVFTPSFTLDSNSVIDTAAMETSGTQVAFIAHESQQLKWWRADTRIIEDVPGSYIPKAKSVCIAASRLIALIPPHEIVWSRVSDPTNFDPTAIARKAQTGDNGILVESLSSLSFALYKERSIYLVRAAGGDMESTAFAFQEPIYVEGPAGPLALVNVSGVHIYMTRNGRIGYFNGQGYPNWIADGIWFFLQDDIDQTRAHMIKGIYDYRLHTVTFFYPKKNTGYGNYGMVIINLPFEGIDIQEASQMKAFLGVSQKPITHACEKRFDHFIDRSLLFSAEKNLSSKAQAYYFDEKVDRDGDEYFECLFQTGLQALPDARHMHTLVETFMERGEGYGSVFIEPVLSDGLENQYGTIPDLSGQWVDLETNPVREYKGFGKQSRFIGLKYTWTSDTHVRYSGTVLYTAARKV